MKKLLFLLLLTNAAQAAPYSSAADNFTANFPGKVSTRAEGDMRAYSTPDGKGIYGIAVFHGKGCRNRYEMLKLVKQKDPKARLVAKEIQFGKSALPGLDLSGLDEGGIPMVARIVSAKDRSYLIVCTNYDMTVGQKFVNSFHINEAAPPAPKKPARRKK